MEKNIKRLSMALIITTAVFFLDCFIGVNASTKESLMWLAKATAFMLNILMLVELVLFLIIMTMSMILFYKRAIEKPTAVLKPREKFPVVWLVGAVVCFIVFYLMTNILIGAVS